MISRITPKSELVQQWMKGCPGETALRLAAQAAQWGWDQRGAATEAELQQRADQELDACCEWIAGQDWTCTTAQLRAARRPKPPSLKDQALEAAQRFYAQGHDGCTDEEVKDDFDAICRALRRLEELEAAND
jgi:hypothetical protein